MLKIFTLRVETYFFVFDFAAEKKSLKKCINTSSMNGKGPKSRIKHVERYIKKTSRWKFGLPIIIVTKKMKID